MTNSYATSWITFFVFLSAGIGLANAELVDNGDGTVTDTDRKIMFLKDANIANTAGLYADGRMSWQKAKSHVADLEFAGFKDWRLPKAENADGSDICRGYNCTGSELGHLYYSELRNRPGDFQNSGPFENIQPYYYWTGTETSSGPLTPQGAWHFMFGDDGNIRAGYQWISNNEELNLAGFTPIRLHVWPVRDTEPRRTSWFERFRTWWACLFSEDC